MDAPRRSRLGLTVLLLAAFVLAAQGCGGASRSRHARAPIASTGLSPGAGTRAAPAPVAILSSQAAAVHRQRAPAAAPPAASDVLMLGPSDWLLVGSHGRDGGGGPAFIERTLDGGRHWSTVFSAPDDELWWIGRDGASVVAAGSVSRGDDAAGEEIAPRALLLRSTDGGARFSVVYPRIPPGVAWRGLGELAFSGHGAALAVPRATIDAGLPRGVLRSGDDGASWRLVELPGEGRADWSADWTPNGREAFVAGNTERNSSIAGCRAALWRSTDAGASWQLVRGACGYNEMGVAFLDSSHGFISSGTDPKYRAGQVVHVTNDGGKHWHLAWRDREQYGESPLVQLDFVDREHGWALPGYVPVGANFRYVGDALSTSDGGRHWRDTGQLASAISALPGGSALALVANTSKAAPELALTRDWGARWKRLTALSDVRTEALLGGAGTVSDVTDVGTFVSSDGGEKWAAFDPPQLGPHSTLLAAQPGLTASLDASHDRCALLLSRNGGERWRTLAPPGGTLQRIVVGEGGGGFIHCTQESAAFASPTRGLASSIPDGGSCKLPSIPSEDNLYTTTDGGLHWQRRQAGPLGPASEAVAASGEHYVALANSSGGVSERPCARIAISPNSGRSWTTQAFPAGQECAGTAAYGSEIWVTCEIERSESKHSVVYHSTDGGRTWRVHTSASSSFVPSQIVATGPDRALAISSPEPEPEDETEGEGEGPSLWRSTDGGATWTQSWPALPIGPASEATREHLRG